jgi:antitoxin (DNA-binding transcriptional repressor) of toxin-antitoxin stability system
MKIRSVGEFKTNFSRVLKKAQAGAQVAITFGKSKEIVATLVTKASSEKYRRKIGLLDSKVKIKFGLDFKMTEKEFLGA